MYCPVCLNDTLKLASSGVAKFTFNGKAKSTSQFFYNVNQDKKEQLAQKLEDVIKDYFSYYSNFQNKDPIKFVEAYSIDFKCKNKCVINVNHKVNIIGVLFQVESLEEALIKMGQKYNIPLDLKLPRN